MARLQNGCAQRRLETLNRVKTACDDISSGKAIEYAKKAGEDPLQFRILPRRINPTTVSNYIRLRRRLEGEKLWPGPHRVTLQEAELKLYLDARETEANGALKPTKRKSRRAETILEIVSKIDDPHSRLAVMSAIQEGQDARRKLQLVQTAAPKLWGVDLDAIIDGTAANPDIASGSNLSEDHKIVLRELLRRLTNNTELRHFGLVCDDNRVKMSGSTGATLVHKAELSLLRSFANLSTQRAEGG